MSDAADCQPAELELQRAFLRRLARELVRGEAAAEDLVQDAFVRALERPPSSGAALKAWLGRVVRRLAINRARGGRRAAERERRAARPEALPSHEEALASLELQERLIAAVKGLGEPYRTTLWLRFHEGLSPAQIARRERAPEKTVESRLTRGLALLRAELDRQSGGDRTRWLGGMLCLARAGSAAWTVPLIGVGAMKGLTLTAALVVVLGLAWLFRSSSAPPIRAEPAPVASAEELRAPTAAAAPVANQRTPIELETAQLAPTEPRGALRILVRWSDGTAASDVGLFVFPDDDPLGERNVVCTRTDQEGRALVEAIHPGRVRVETERGGRRETTVEERRETEVVLDLAAGISIEGTVSGASGAPIGGAEILLVSKEKDWLASRVVARTAPNGVYFVRDASPELSLSARAGSFAPAQLEPLEGRLPGSTARIDFSLGLPALGLHGIVVDSARQPVAGALVAVGDPGGYYMSQEGLVGGRRVGMPVVVSDDAGRFRADGVEQSRGLPFAVLARGFPVTIGAVAADLGCSSFAEIVLDDPCSIEGVVQDPQGLPLAGASVRLVSISGVQAKDIPFALPRASTDEQGRYHLELVPPGQVGLRADPPAGSSLGHRFARVVLGAGATELDLTLPGEDAIHGRLLDWRGVSVAGYSVYTFSINTASRIQKVRTDGAGAFELRRCALSPYTLDVLNELGQRMLRVREVGPAAEELTLRLERPGSLSGRFIDEVGSPGPRVDAHLSRAGSEFGFTAALEGTRFSFSELPPGRYKLMIGQWDRGPHRSEWLSVAPGEHVDLGEIRREPPGSVRVALVPVPGSFGIALVDRGFDVVAFIEPEGTDLVAREVSPGEHYVRVDADGHAVELQPVTIRPGEETRVSIRLEAGVARTLQFLTPDTAEWNWIRVTIRDASGRLRFGRREERYEARPSVLALLPPGTFSLEAETDTDLAARGTFAVEALDEQHSPLTFELR